jgi:hypothetical protein
VNVQFIGVVTFLVGLVGLYKGPPLDVWAYLVSLLFGAAAGVILERLGSMNMLPAHIMLGFFALGMVARRGSLARGLGSLAPGRAGFWFVLTVAYGAVATIFMPRLFAGATEVFTVARGDSGPGLLRVPLGPVSGNVTQMVYIVGDLVCLMACTGVASTRSGLEQLCRATLFCGLLNLLFAVLDYATFATGTADLLAFMRNATYRMLDDVEIVGFKRIVGSFPEASTFAYATLGFFAFSCRLALAGVHSRVAGSIAALSLLALLLSTSTTAYVGVTICAALLYGQTAARFFARGATLGCVAFVFAAPVAVACVVLGAALYEPVWSVTQELLGKTVFQKAASSSAIERGMWNVQALVNFRETAYLGAGVGSVRASSVLAAVPASVGVPGSLVYAAFLYGVLLNPFSRAMASREKAIRSAARSACFAQFLAGVFAGTFIDLGLPFFVFAAIATGGAGPMARLPPRRLEGPCARAIQ